MTKCPCFVDCKVLTPKNKNYDARCRATKGYEICKCNGDELKCDFYPQVRVRALELLRQDTFSLQIDDIIKQIQLLDLNGYQIEETKRDNIISKLHILKENLEKENIT